MQNGQCQAKTVKGSQCKRKAKVGSYCSQHAKKLGVTEGADPIYTITFGDVCENDSNHGNQQIGDKADHGFTVEDLELARDAFENVGIECELVNLKLKTPADLFDEVEDEAAVLVVKQGAPALLMAEDLTVEDLLREQKELNYDTKFIGRNGKVQNKRARHNICFGSESQEPNYEEGEGTIIAFEDVPALNCIREGLPEFFGDEASDMVAEGNLYYDPNKCGIGFHGDAERRKVIGLRIGGPMSLHFQWFHQSKPVGERVEFILESGDMYMMSEKAVGTDWRKRKVPTLRHAAGCEKYLTIKSK